MLCKVKLNILGYFVVNIDVENYVENVQNLDFQGFMNGRFWKQYSYGDE